MAADIVFSIAAGFLAGIVAASLQWNPVMVIGWVIFVALLVAILRIIPSLADFFGSAPIGVRFSLPTAAAAAFFFGFGYYHCYFAWQAAMTKLPQGKSAEFSVVVSDEPTLSNSLVLLKAELESPYAGAITIFAPQDSDYGYGDELRVDGEVNKPSDSGEAPAIFPRRLQIIGHHKDFLLREWLIDLKHAIIYRYNAMLPADQAMLLGGIAFGAKQDFKADLKNAMAASGTTHLVAISGYNITIIIVAAEAVLAGLFSRRVKFYATVALIVLFVLMTGLQSSAIRAAIMGFLALAAKQSGRVFSMQHAIMLTAAVMVAIQPAILLHDAGFELSFLSLLGIVCLCDPLKKITDRFMHYGAESAFDWKEAAVTTFSAQLGTMPVLIAVFNQFSATAIFANVLLLGTVPLTMLFGFALALFGFISIPFSFFAARLTSLLLSYQLFIIRLFAALAVPLPLAFNSAIVFIFYYGALAWFAYEYR